MQNFEQLCSAQSSFAMSKSHGNSDFVQRVIKSSSDILTLVHELDTRIRRSNLTWTWYSYNHSATIYYQ